MRPTFTLAVLSCGLCWGQAANDCTPSTLNIPGAQYPCVYSDSRVTFRLAAPDAKTSSNGVFADAAALNKEVKLLFLGIGFVEGPGTKDFSVALTKAGIKNVYFESAGTAHEWLTWRRCLNDFAPRLFK